MNLPSVRNVDSTEKNRQEIDSYSFKKFYKSCALVGLCNSAFVDTLGKCSYKDDKCVAELIQSVIKEAGDNGIPELDIALMDPIDLKNLSIPIVDFFNVFLEEGESKGVKSCVIGSMHNNLDKGVTKMDLTCDLTITAKFKLDGSTPFVKTLFGQDSIIGTGNVKLKLEKIHMKMRFFYHVMEKDGEIYFNYHENELKSNFEIENFIMSVNELFIGKQDVSGLVEVFFNQNWKSVMPTFGRSIFNVAMKILSDILNKFFTKLPAKYYYTDDLSSFVKN